MSLRRGFFRITLILSILVGTVSSFWVLEDTIKHGDGGIVSESLPRKLHERVSDEAFSRKMDKEFPDLPTKSHESFGPDYILYWLPHLAVLSLPGIATVWFIYWLIGWVIIPYIVAGFKGSSQKEGEPD